MYWYFQQTPCLNIKQHAIHNIPRLAWWPCVCAPFPPRATAHRVHAFRRHWIDRVMLKYKWMTGTITLCKSLIVLDYGHLCMKRKISEFCCVFPRLVYPMLPVSPDCPFLIAPSVFSNVYLRKKIICLSNLNFRCRLPQTIECLITSLKK